MICIGCHATEIFQSRQPSRGLRPIHFNRITQCQLNEFVQVNIHDRLRRYANREFQTIQILLQRVAHCDQISQPLQHTSFVLVEEDYVGRRRDA